MKPTTEIEFKELLSKFSEMIICFEDAHSVTIGSEFLLLFNSRVKDYKERFVYNGETFVRHIKDEEIWN